MEQKGFTIWFTGLPCSGKSSIADVVFDVMKNSGLPVERLDGDVIRQHLWKVLGFQSGHDLDFDLNGASHLEIASMKGGDIKIKASGASHLTGNVTASREMKFDITGASWIELTGSADYARLAISGASQAKLANFILNNVDVTVSGASNTSIKVIQKINLNLSGASRLEYSGSPTIGSVSVTGASTLKQK